jgi:hypothetical protein
VGAVACPGSLYLNQRVALALLVFLGSLATRIPRRHWQSQWHPDLSARMVRIRFETKPSARRPIVAVFTFVWVCILHNFTPIDSIRHSATIVCDYVLKPLECPRHTRDMEVVRGRSPENDPGLGKIADRARDERIWSGESFFCWRLGCRW